MTYGAVPTFRRMRVCLGLFLALMFLNQNATAQEQGVVYRPGQTIVVSVTFGGPNAEKVTAAQMVLQINSLRPNQQGFSTSLQCNGIKNSEPKDFGVSCQIPNNQGSGEYYIADISATVGPIGSIPSIVLYYNHGEFPDKKFTIENPQTVVKPIIKSIKVLPQP